MKVAPTELNEEVDFGFAKNEQTRRTFGNDRTQWRTQRTIDSIREIQWGCAAVE